MAGALAEIARQTLLKDFRNIDSSDANVILIEGSNKLLNGFREPIPEEARNQLESIGVENVKVVFSPGRKISSNSILSTGDDIESTSEITPIPDIIQPATKPIIVYLFNT